MVRNLVILLFLEEIAVLSQNLAGRYEFWDYYGSYVYDYSGNTRHAEISNSGDVPIFTDRGLYIHTGYSLKFPNNLHNVFPTACTDMVVSVLLNPRLDTEFCLLALIAGSKSIQVCFKNNSGKLEISIEGSLTFNQSTSLNFNGWRLYTIRFSQVLQNTLLYVYLDGDDTNTALILFIASFSFVTSSTYWKLGSTMEGFLYQIWWNCQVTTSIQTLTYSMISISNSCATLNVETPLTECLSNELDKFKNSAGIACPSTCTSLNQSCDKDQGCISSCKYKCLNPSQCRSATYPVCSGSPPAGCRYYPNTDICYSCNTGWLMSTLILGVCEITVPNCKTFNSSAVCTECNYGSYMSADNPPACIQCHSGCEKCARSSSAVICSICSSGHFRQLDLSSCSTTCPDTYYGSTITDPDSCLSCYPNCKTCAYKSSILYTICSECNSGYFLQPRLQVFVYSESYKPQCATTCPIEYYPDGVVSPASCMPCKPNCEDCTSNSNCTKCIVGYILDSTTSTCNICVYACRECISTTQCSKCYYWYWLEETTKVCKVCSRWCIICVNDNTCQECYSGSNTLILNGIKTCKISCANYYYIAGYDYECLDYSGISISYCIVTTLEIKCQNCLTTIFGTSDCPITICPAYCKQCYTINSVIYCTQCPYGYYLQPDKLSCQITCPDFYYKYDRFCYSCKANCKKCQTDVNYCEECGNDHSLSVDKSVCVSVCPTGHYSKRSGIWQCQPCLSKCDVCTSSNDCQTCNNSWYIVINSSGILSCQVLCPSRTYSKLDKVCGNCMTNCDVCALNGSGDLICSTCAVGYLLKNNNCYELKCDPNCLTCVISTAELRCDLCKDTYYIQPEEHLCATTCTDKYYPDIVTKRCQSCSSNCESCVEFSPSISSCTLCNTNHIFKVSLGVNICEFATCPVSCTDCTIISEGILCNACNTSYFMQPLTKECKTSCPLKYYGDTLTNTCKVCSSNCLQCSSSECKVCSNGYYLQPDKTCLNSCPDGYYKYLLEKTCKECGLSNCLKCDYVSFKVICKLCNSTYYIRTDGSCNTECEDEYYQDSSNMKCEKCPLNNCARCIKQADSSFYCFKCMYSYYLHALEPQPCLAECPLNYFKDDYLDIKACSACPEACKICTSARNCSECDMGNYLQPSGSVKYCDTTCHNEYFKDDYLAIKACSTCPIHCKTCFTRSECSECITNYYLQPTGSVDFCDATCPESFFPSSTTPLRCSPCPANCLECDETACKKCRSRYAINVPVVYPNESCMPCPLNCASCEFIQDRTKCTACDNEFYSQPEGSSTECKSSCPDEYYIDMSSKSCLKCPIGTYEAGNECWQCISPCRTCRGVDECYECIDNAVLANYNCMCENNYRYNGLECELQYLSLSLCFENSKLAMRFEYSLKEAVDPINLVLIIETVEYNQDSFMLESQDLQNYNISSSLFLINSEKVLTVKFKNIDDILDIYDHKLDMDHYFIPIPSYKIIETESDSNQESDSELEITHEEEIKLEQARSMQSSTESTMAGASVVGLGMSIVNLNLSTLWSLLNSIQILAYIPLLNITMPSRALGVCKAFSSLNIMPNLFSFFESGSGPKISKRYSQGGVETAQFMVNTGKNLSIFSIYLAVYIVVKLISLATRWVNNESRFRKLLSKVLGSFEWNGFTRLYIEAYLEFSFGSMLNLYYTSINGLQAADLILSVIFLILTFMTPFCVLNFLLKNSDSIKLGESHSKWNTLYDGFNTSETGMIFNVVFLGRRFLYAVFLVFLADSACIQVMLSALISLFSFHFILFHKPYSSKKENILNCLSEGASFCIISLLYPFRFDLNEKLTEYLDWIIVILLYISFLTPLIVNLIGTLIKISKKIIQMIRTRMIEDLNTNKDVRNKSKT